MNLEQLRQFKPQIQALAIANKAGNVRVFGSTARGDTHYASDIDLLVTLAPEASLLNLGGLLEDLKELLGPRVDVVADDCIHPRMMNAILKDAVPL